MGKILLAVLALAAGGASALPGSRDAIAFPNPASGTDPIIRAAIAAAAGVEITIYDVTGRAVHSGAVSAPVLVGGELVYEYRWTGRKASGVYLAVIHGRKADGSRVGTRVKLAVVR
jgi:hypothetical protein